MREFISRLQMSLWAIVFLVCLPFMASAETGAISLETDWQYRWGDSPFGAGGVPQWTLKTDDTSAWDDIGFPSNPPGRDGQTNVWYKRTLPAGVWSDPVLYVYSIDLIAEVYLDGKKIYNYGTFDKNGHGRFEGWPWHMIELPKGFSDKTIYFRVYSSYSDIGLWGEVKLMERRDLVHHVIMASLEQMVISALSGLIALVALMFAVVQTSKRTYLWISFFTFASGLMLLAQTQVKQFLFNAPLVWDHIGAGAYFVLPVAMAFLFRIWINKRFVMSVTWIGFLHAIFAVMAIALSAIGVFELSTVYLVFDATLTISLTVLFLIAFAQFRAVNTDAKIFVVTFAVFSVFLIVDMGVAHNFLPWTRMPIAWGVLIYSLTMIGLSLHHFASNQRDLKQLNQTLEQRVLERTAELEKLNAEILKAKAQAETANVMKSKFFAAASHDLRQPMQALRLFSYALADVLKTDNIPKDPQRDHMLYGIDQSVGVLSERMDALLDMAKFDEGQVSIDKRIFAVQDLLENARQLFEMPTREKGMVFRVVPCSALVNSDPIHVKRIIDNFVSNAVRYAKTGKILLGCRRLEDAIRIEVWDTGPGIAEDDLDHIFDEFYQLDNMARERGKGVGLGLAIVKRTAQALDIDYGVRSHLGKGSVFWVSLPMQKVKPPKPSIKIMRSQQKEEHGGRILIVEDDLDVLKATTMLLKVKGHEVVGSPSSQQALAMIQDGTIKPDLLILDYRLPGDMNGIELCDRIRAILGEDVPGILISGDTASEELMSFSQASLVHMVKPIDVDELNAQVRALLD